jgi:hypothetical protein
MKLKGDEYFAKIGDKHRMGARFDTVFDLKMIVLQPWQELKK